jgi:hypothetical protein
MRGSRLTALAASGISATGLLAGHWLAYAAVHPSAPTRHAALAPAHGWLNAAQELVPLVSVVAAAAIVLQRVGRPSGARAERGGMTTRLATLQIVAFTGLEIAERLAGGGWGDLPAILVLGASAQVLTAGLAALVVERLSSLGARLGETLARTPRLTIAGRTAVAAAERPASARSAASPFAGRAPPLSV